MDNHFTAPGKIILFGEHAVVYGKPAIAIPVSGMRASAWSEPNENGLIINALDLNEKFDLQNTSNQFSILAQTILSQNKQNEPNLTINLSSKLPQGSGMGSSAATATAVCRALSNHLGVDLDANQVSELVFNAEKIGGCCIISPTNCSRALLIASCVIPAISNFWSICVSKS